MADPFALFDEWFAKAQASEPNDPNAMALATADSVGNPSVRMVLLKGHGPDGFTFYTNEESSKGKELKENPSAALLFHWKTLRRQVRIEGEVERVSNEDADAYFATRSRDSQLGAWASDQSRPLQSREVFEARYEAMKARFENRPISAPTPLGRLPPCPAHLRILAGPAPSPARTPGVRGAERWKLERGSPLPVTQMSITPEERSRLTFRAAMASIAMALTLIILKSWAAYHTDSTAMLGSLADSGLDLVASLIVLLGVRIAAQPADYEHRFGHGKAEALASLVQVILITISAIFIGVRAVQRLISAPRRRTRNSASAYP